MLATQLTAKGYRVFAACLTETGRQALLEKNGHAKNLTAILVDVTKQADIDACARLVAAQCPEGLKYVHRRPPGSSPRA